MRSRLEYVKKKQLTTKIIFSLLVLITIIIFIFTAGLKILLNASAFIANLKENRTNSNSLTKNNNFIGNVSIDSIPVASNSSQIYIGGSVLNYDKLEFYINGDLVKETVLSTSDNFNEEIGDLVKGNNQIYVIAKSKDSSQERKSKEFTVIYKSDKPKLEIKEPTDNLTTSQQELKVMGSTDKDTYVRINDLPVVVDAQGNFETLVKLKDGENKINISAEDLANNIESKTLTVIYQKD